MDRNAPGLMVVEFALGLTNAELLDRARATKAARESGEWPYIVACIAGFDADPRELADIPECRAFAQRCIDQGIIAYLDVAAIADPLTRGGLGACEFAMIAEGGPGAPLSARMRAALRRCYRAAEAALGPYTPRHPE